MINIIYSNTRPIGARIGNQASPGKCVSWQVKHANATKKVIGQCCGRQTRRRSDFRGPRADREMTPENMLTYLPTYSYPLA